MDDKNEIDVFAAKPKAGRVDPSAFVPPTLASLMNVNLVVNDTSEAILLHDKQFPFPINWAEYDKDLRKLYLISYRGTPLELGIPIPDKLGQKLEKNLQFKTALIQNETLADFYVLPFVIRDTSRH